MKSNLEVHIEELVLHGFPSGFAPADRRLIGESVQRELARLCAEAGTPLSAQEYTLRSLDAGTFKLAPDASPATIGTHIARAVHGGLKR